MSTKRLGTIFHETFPLSRQSIFQILNAINNNPTISSVSQTEREHVFQQDTSLGTRYIKAMPRYALGCGFMNSEYILSDFGSYVNVHDKLLDQISTQWLMHYHLSAPQGPGPSFWNVIVSKRFYPGSDFTADEIVEQIGNFIWETEDKILSERAVRSTVTIFLGTYTKTEGLGKLNLLEVSESGRYVVRDPASPSAWVVGYALLDFWEANFPGMIGVGLDTLHESGFGKLFMLGKNELEAKLQTLQETHFMEIHRAAPPYQVVLLRTDRDFLLKKIYGAN